MPTLKLPFNLKIHLALEEVARGAADLASASGLSSLFCCLSLTPKTLLRRLSDGSYHLREDIQFSDYGFTDLLGE
jgi:hypothetical protein